MQQQYDAGRDLVAAVDAALPAGLSCARLARALARYAAAQVAQAEGADRGAPAQSARAGVAAAAARSEIRAARGLCVTQPEAVRPPQPGRIDDPASFEAFFGAVRARAPAGAVSATVAFAGRPPVRAAVRAGWLRTRVSSPPRQGELAVTFLAADGAVLGRSLSRAVWLLPRSASAAPGSVRDDAPLTRRLALAASSFPGISAVFTRDLVTGDEAAWNAEARFPAASTVKLGVLAAALRRFGPRPEQHASFYDLQALAGWSSNLAANRLAAQIGGAATAEAQLRRLGAVASTYRGNYLVGTALVPRSPPPISAVVTTARDLAAALTTLQRAAIGEPGARAASGLSVHEARVALGLLLSSQASGENAGMLRRALGPAVPIAQKHGWIRDARLTAAIVYTERGPRVVVICTYARDLRPATAQALGARVVRALGRP